MKTKKSEVKDSPFNFHNLYTYIN